MDTYTLVSSTDTPINDADKTVKVITHYKPETVVLSVSVHSATILIPLSKRERKMLAESLLYTIKD